MIGVPDIEYATILENLSFHCVCKKLNQPNEMNGAEFRSLFCDRDRTLCNEHRRTCFAWAEDDPDQNYASTFFCLSKAILKTVRENSWLCFQAIAMKKQLSIPKG